MSNPRDLIAATGLSQSQAARLLQTPLRTVQHWCGGHTRMPDAARLLVELMRDHEEVREWLVARGGTAAGAAAMATLPPPQ